MNDFYTCRDHTDDYYFCPLCKILALQEMMEKLIEEASESAELLATIGKLQYKKDADNAVIIEARKVLNESFFR